MRMRLTEDHIEQMLELQRQCLESDDIFLPTSRAGYLRAFQFSNFCLGYMEEGELIAFLNCSVPTERSSRNLGRGRLPEEELKYAGHMNTLLVKKGCRRHGVGRELVLAALEEFLRLGCRHIFVTVSPENTASLKLLESLAFQTVDRISLGGEERLLQYRELTPRMAQSVDNSKET